MKKVQKSVALTLATILSASALATASFTTMAQDAYTLGDVDMDGVITGHDSAMVSRYLNVDADLLDATQLTLADVNEDGVVDATDADLIHAQEVYTIGDFDLNGTVDPIDGYLVLFAYAKTQVSELTIDADAALLDNLLSELCVYGNNVTLSSVQYNLADTNGDGIVSSLDSYYLLAAYATKQVCDTFYGEGRYDLYAASIDYSNGEEVAASQEESIVEEYLAD